MAYYKIISHAGSGKYLNLAAAGPIIARTNVNIWDAACVIDQIWSISSLGTGQYVKTINNLSYMLNVMGSTQNCDVYTQNTDSKVNFVKVAGTTNIYYIQSVSNPSLYLIADGVTSGSNVFWETKPNIDPAPADQQWQIIPVTLPNVFTRVAAGGYETLGEDQMETNAVYIKSYLTSEGFSLKAIAAMLGNFQIESTINPAAWEVSGFSTSGGYGLPQWTPASRFLNWASANSYISTATAASINTLAYSAPVTLMDSELTFLLAEMSNPNYWYTPSDNSSKYGTTTSLTYSQFKTSTLDVSVLTRVFCGHYERPSNAGVKMNERIAAAQKWYSFLS